MKSWMLLAFGLCSGLLVTSAAEAGVKGGRFEGNVFNSFNNIVALDDSFYLNGAFQQTESGTNTFTGTYTEQGFLVTTWQATINDGSPDGNSQLGGTCYFGFVTTFWATNTDINISAFGLLFRTGNASTP